MFRWPVASVTGMPHHGDSYFPCLRARALEPPQHLDLNGLFGACLVDVFTAVVAAVVAEATKLTPPGSDEAPADSHGCHAIAASCHEPPPPDIIGGVPSGMADAPPAPVGIVNPGMAPEPHAEFPWSLLPSGIWLC